MLNRKQYFPFRSIIIRRSALCAYYIIGNTAYHRKIKLETVRQIRFQ
jgi:hypothetical protein